MVVSIARQAVIIKSQTGNSILLGNYECAYALGLLSKAAGIPEDENFTDMREWRDSVLEQLNGFASEDARLMEVFRILKNYEPDDVVDAQMKELYAMGFGEPRMWQM